MSWDANKPSLLTNARMMAMSPDAVYHELQMYGQYQDADERYFSFREDKQLEKALLARNEPLINLALAEYGGVADVALHLWKQPSTASKNEQYQKAVRLALLRNPHHLRHSPLGEGPFGVIPIEDLQLIVDSNDREEIVALLNNPGAKKLLGRFFNRESPFHAIDDSKYLQMIYIALKSPCLTDNRENEFGPDMQSWDIHDGILNLLETFPVSEGAVDALHWLLSSINPEHVRSPRSDPRPMFKRWQDLTVSESFTKEYSEPVGRYTSMDFKDEFVCLIASLYGAYYYDGKTIHLGALDASDPVLRYCHYGRTDMKPEDMAKAWNKDGEAFVFAVLHGYSVSTDQQRAVVESHLRGIHQIRLYYKRLINARRRRRNENAPVRAITSDGQALLESLSEYRDPPTEEMARLQRIEQQVQIFAHQNARTAKSVQWIIVLLIVMLVVLLKPKW